MELATGSLFGTEESHGPEANTMPSPPTVERTPDVPAQVFEQFLQALAGAGVSPELVARLRKTLVEDQTFTERALTAAVLDEEPLL